MTYNITAFIKMPYPVLEHSDVLNVVDGPTPVLQIDSLGARVTSELIEGKRVIYDLIVHDEITSVEYEFREYREIDFEGLWTPVYERVEKTVRVPRNESYAVVVVD